MIGNTVTIQAKKTSTGETVPLLAETTDLAAVRYLKQRKEGPVGRKEGNMGLYIHKNH